MSVSRVFSLALLLLPAVMPAASVTYVFGANAPGGGGHFAFVTSDFIPYISGLPLQANVPRTALLYCNACQGYPSAPFIGPTITINPNGVSAVALIVDVMGNIYSYYASFTSSQVSTPGFYELPRMFFNAYPSTLEVVQRGDQVTYMPEPATLGMASLSLAALIFMHLRTRS